MGGATGTLFTVQTWDGTLRAGTLLSDAGVVVHLDWATRLDGPVELTPGVLIGAEVEQHGSKFRAVRLFTWAPPPALRAELEARLAAFRRADIDLGIVDADAYLCERVLRGGLAGLAHWSAASDLFYRFTSIVPTFCLVSWCEDIQPGLDEMIDLMRQLGHRFEPSPALIERSNRDLDTSDDWEACRMRLCAALAAEANAGLGAAEGRRWHAIDSSGWDDDNQQYWVFVSDAQAAALRASPPFGAL